MLKYSASVAPDGDKSWIVHSRLFSVYTFNYFLIIWDYCKLSIAVLKKNLLVGFVYSKFCITAFIPMSLPISSSCAHLPMPPIPNHEVHVSLCV